MNGTKKDGIEKVKPKPESDLVMAKKYLGMASVLMERYNERMSVRLKREVKILNARYDFEAD